MEFELAMFGEPPASHPAFGASPSTMMSFWIWKGTSLGGLAKERRMPTKASLASGGTVQPAMTIHFHLSRAFWIEPVT